MHCSASRRRFKCSWEDCGKSFDRKADLRRHYRIHTNERPYSCGVECCNKSFIQRSALTVHSRTHTGEKPYVCDHEGCQKTFSDSSSRARHRRTHMGRRPYICREPACERRFCRKMTLTKHQQRAHPLEPVTRTPSGDTSSEQFFLASVADSLQNHRYLFAQQPYYRNVGTAAHGFHSQQNLPMTPVAAQTQPPSVTHNNTVNSSLEVQHAQQQYLELMQQQQPGQMCTGYSPVQYQPPYALPTVEGQPLTVSYTPIYQHM